MTKILLYLFKEILQYTYTFYSCTFENDEKTIIVINISKKYWKKKLI